MSPGSEVPLLALLALVAADPGDGTAWSFNVRGRQDAYLVTRDGAQSVRDGIDLVVHA